MAPTSCTNIDPCLNPDLDPNPEPILIPILTQPGRYYPEIYQARILLRSLGSRQESNGYAYCDMTAGLILLQTTIFYYYHTTILLDLGRRRCLFKVAPNLCEGTAQSPAQAFLEALRAPTHFGEQPRCVGCWLGSSCGVSTPALDHPPEDDCRAFSQAEQYRT